MIYRGEYRQDRTWTSLFRHVLWSINDWFKPTHHCLQRYLLILRFLRFFFVLCMCVGSFWFYVLFSLFIPPFRLLCWNHSPFSRILLFDLYVICQSVYLVWFPVIIFIFLLSSIYIVCVGSIEREKELTK